MEQSVFSGARNGSDRTALRFLKMFHVEEVMRLQKTITVSRAYGIRNIFLDNYGFILFFSSSSYHY